MVVPGQTDWRRRALLQRALSSAWPIILHPKTFSGAIPHEFSAYSSKNSRPHTNKQRSQSLEGGPRTIKRRHAQASPVSGCCR